MTSTKSYTNSCTHSRRFLRFLSEEGQNSHQFSAKEVAIATNSDYAAMTKAAKKLREAKLVYCHQEDTQGHLWKHRIKPLNTFAKEWRKQHRVSELAIAFRMQIDVKAYEAFEECQLDHEEFADVVQAIARMLAVMSGIDEKLLLLLPVEYRPYWQNQSDRYYTDGGAAA